MEKKAVYPIKTCPWCKALPKFVMNYNDDPWTPHFHCKNAECCVNPKSKYVPIRKKQKKDPEVIQMKIVESICYWNHNNPSEALQGMEFDFIKMSKQEDFW